MKNLCTLVLASLVSSALVADAKLSGGSRQLLNPAIEFGTDLGKFASGLDFPFRSCQICQGRNGSVSRLLTRLLLRVMQLLLTSRLTHQF